jgi:hypothetical protein
MESTHETALRFRGKANTAIRECLFSRYRAEGDICQVRRGQEPVPPADRPARLPLLAPLALQLTKIFANHEEM